MRKGMEGIGANTRETILVCLFRSFRYLFKTREIVWLNLRLAVLWQHQGAKGWLYLILYFVFSSILFWKDATLFHSRPFKGCFPTRPGLWLTGVDRAVLASSAQPSESDWWPSPRAQGLQWLHKASVPAHRWDQDKVSSTLGPFALCGGQWENVHQFPKTYVPGSHPASLYHTGSRNFPRGHSLGADFRAQLSMVFNKPLGHFGALFFQMRTSLPNQFINNKYNFHMPIWQTDS